MRSPGGVRKSRVIPFSIAVLGLFILAAGYYSHVVRSRPSAEAATNAHLAHDPSIPRKAGPTYDETLNGVRYENRDLGLAIDAPNGWNSSLGSRIQGGQAHEGLVVRMQPDAPLDEATQMRPLISVVRRALPTGTEPVAYIRLNLLGPGKEVVEKPNLVDAGGRRMGRVVYDMPSGTGTIRIMQLVHVKDREAVIVSAMAPKAAFPGLAATFDGVVASLRLRS